MRKFFFAKAIFIWFAAASFWNVFAQVDLPIVNVAAPTNSVPEDKYYSLKGGFFVFTSSQTNGVNLNLEFSGTAGREDFYLFFQNNPSHAYTNFPTSLSIRPGTNSVTLGFRPAEDIFVEGTETLRVRILPDAAYTVGTSPEASVEILDRTITPQFISTATTATNLTVQVASPADAPIVIEMSEDLANWNAYTNFNASGNTTTVTLPFDSSAEKYFRAVVR